MMSSVSGGLRRAIEKTGTVLGGLGAFLVAGVIVAAIATWVFGEFAETVMAGQTQSFDDAVLRWMAAHHTTFLDTAMLEITSLGTGVAVLMIVGVAALFLSLTHHRYSAALLLAATAGGNLLNLVLKVFFGRPRPHIFAWGTHALSSSFPSGHAMSAAIVYSTVAYLAARLQKRIWSRVLTLLVAAIVIVATSASRVYLGVHYPSDVVAGVIIGIGWAAFCMATLEGVQRFLRRNADPSQTENGRSPEMTTSNP
ncbi:MAG TPA: phosphatase PAP2 family protein [Gemmatimonadaceae bacterium]|nr:phosphatase PAP2 family protein [Gemmatimonadaceae bacterium]